MSISVSSGSLRSTSAGDSSYDRSFALGGRLDDSTLNEIDSRMKFSYSFGDIHDVDGNACLKILEWMTALFAEVAGSLMDCETALDGVHEQSMIACDSQLGNFSTTAAPLDAYDIPDALPTVNLPGHHFPHMPLPIPIALRSGPSLVSMTDSEDDDLFANEQVSTIDLPLLSFSSADVCADNDRKTSVYVGSTSRANPKGPRPWSKRSSLLLRCPQATAETNPRKNTDSATADSEKNPAAATYTGFLSRSSSQ